jgi:ABC-type ATPase with predicted acetyltransferase domain
MFGLTVERLTNEDIVYRCSLSVNDGDIIYITGPSGAGKSVLLNELKKQIEPTERIDLLDIEIPSDKTVIDCVEGNVIASMKHLSMAGLNDVFCILNQPANLSDGQKWRFRLAMAMAAKKKYIIADEFCSNLDRITAAVISANIRKHATLTKSIFILASSHDDTLLDLQPDIIVVKELSGEAKVVYKELRRQAGI